MVTDRYRQEAARLRMAVMSGLESPHTAITWADSIIAEQSVPDYWFIEISLSASKDRMGIASLLGKHSEGTDHFDALRCFLGRVAWLLANDEVELPALAAWLSDIEECNNADLPEDLLFVRSIAWLYELAGLEVFGDLGEVEGRFIDNLRGFRRERSAAPDWYSVARHE